MSFQKWNFKWCTLNNSKSDPCACNLIADSLNTDSSLGDELFSLSLAAIFATRSMRSGISLSRRLRLIETWKILDSILSNKRLKYYFRRNLQDFQAARCTMVVDNNFWALPLLDMSVSYYQKPQSKTYSAQRGLEMFGFYLSLRKTLQRYKKSRNEQSQLKIKIITWTH